MNSDSILSSSEIWTGGGDAVVLAYASLSSCLLIVSKTIRAIFLDFTVGHLISLVDILVHILLFVRGTIVHFLRW